MRLYFPAGRGLVFFWKRAQVFWGPMAALAPPLDDLRAEVDRIDQAVLELLVERTEVVREIGRVKADRLSGRIAARPAREAEILRRLVALAGDRFPRAVLVRMWRELLAATTRLQTPMSVSVFGAQQGVATWDLARDHFGSVTPMVRVESATQALRSVSDGSATVAVMPLPNDDDPWWLALVSDHHDRLQVFARLPFVARGAGEGEEAQALALARLEPESSGDDLAAARDRGGIGGLARPAPGSSAGGRAEPGLARRLALHRAAPDGASGRGRQLHRGGRRADRPGPERGARRGLADRAGRRLPSTAAASLSPAPAAAQSASNRQRGTRQMASLRPRPGILEIEPYVGGRSEIAGASRVIKLSANEFGDRTEPEGDRGLPGGRARHPPLSGWRCVGAARRDRPALPAGSGADPVRRRLGRADPAADARLCRAGRRGAVQRARLSDVQAQRARRRRDAGRSARAPAHDRRRRAARTAEQPHAHGLHRQSEQPDRQLSSGRRTRSACTPACPRTCCW